MSITQNMINAMVNNKIQFVTTVPCKQLSGIIELLEHDERILHVPSNKEDEGMGLCCRCVYGWETPMYYNAEHSDWGYHQHPSNFNPILPYTSSNINKLSGKLEKKFNAKLKWQFTLRLF